MLFLLFQLGDDRYALASGAHRRECCRCVAAEADPRRPADRRRRPSAIADDTVPLIDLTQLALGRPGRACE